MSTAVFLVVAAVVGLAVILAIYAPSFTGKWFRRFVTARRVAATTLSVLFALYFLSTGAPALMLFGALLLAVAVWYVLFAPEFVWFRARVPGLPVGGGDRYG